MVEPDRSLNVYPALFIIVVLLISDSERVFFFLAAVQTEVALDLTQVLQFPLHHLRDFDPLVLFYLRYLPLMLVLHCVLIQQEVLTHVQECEYESRQGIDGFSY